MQWLRLPWLVWTWGLLIPIVAAADPSFVCAGYEPVEAPLRAGKIAQYVQINTQGTVRALVVFADFAAATPVAPVPAFASGLFDRLRDGSLSHFYDTMSFGQFELTGTVLHKRYTVPRPAPIASNSPGQRGPYGQFVKALIASWSFALVSTMRPGGMLDGGFGMCPNLHFCGIGSRSACSSMGLFFMGGGAGHFVCCDGSIGRAA